MNKAILLLAIWVIACSSAAAQPNQTEATPNSVIPGPTISYDFLVRKKVGTETQTGRYRINRDDPNTVTLVEFGTDCKGSGPIELDGYVTDSETGKQYTVTKIGNQIYGLCDLDERDYMFKIPPTVEELTPNCFSFVHSVYTASDFHNVEYRVFAQCSKESSLKKIGAGAFAGSIVGPNDKSEIVIYKGVMESTYCIPKSLVLGDVELKCAYRPYPDGLSAEFDIYDFGPPPIFCGGWLGYDPQYFTMFAPKDLISIRCLTATPPKVTGGTLFPNYIQANNSEDGFLLPDYPYDYYVKESHEYYDMCVLTVPKGCREAYASHEEWGKFKNIVESQEPAGIDVLQPDTEGCTMTGVDGGIRVSATGSHMVTVHDIHGRSIRQVRVADGSQLIELPAGFYIVTTDGTAAQKLLVR